MLYNHFKTKFIKEKQRFGIHRLAYEKKMLQREIDNVKEQCIQEQVVNTRSKVQYKLKADKSFCKYYTMGDGQFIKEMRAILEKKSKEILSP